jgi:hypothetical protein
VREFLVLGQRGDHCVNLGNVVARGAADGEGVCGQQGLPEKFGGPDWPVCHAATRQTGSIRTAISAVQFRKRMGVDRLSNLALHAAPHCNRWRHKAGAQVCSMPRVGCEYSKQIMGLADLTASVSNLQQNCFGN